MLQFAPPSTMNSRPIPKRSDSLAVSATRTPNLSDLDDELRDAQRVQSHGQEEDLKDALGRMIGRVEEFSALLSQAYKTQTELETSLKLARSNLQLALANNEMLEDALKRDGLGRGKDVGWRRWSEREGARRGRIIEEEAAERERAHRMSLDSAPVTPNLTSTPNPGTSTPSYVNDSGTTSPPASPPGAPSPAPSQDGRFFRFRFGSGSASSSRPHSPSSMSTARKGELERDAAHLTSASLPSLVVTPSKREEELTAQLEAERVSHRAAAEEKKALEAELESLSQALFEEANKMVAQERIKRAETEEELRQAREEKEALKGALRVVETENGRLRTSSDADKDRQNPSSTNTEKRTSQIRVGSGLRTVSPAASKRSSLSRPTSPSRESSLPSVVMDINDQSVKATTTDAPPTSDPDANTVSEKPHPDAEVSPGGLAGFEKSPWAD